MNERTRTFLKFTHMMKKTKAAIFVIGQWAGDPIGVGELV